MSEMKSFWNYFKIILATVSTLENICEHAISFRNTYEIISEKFPRAAIKLFPPSTTQEQLTALPRPPNWRGGGHRPLPKNLLLLRPFGPCQPRFLSPNFHISLTLQRHCVRADNRPLSRLVKRSKCVAWIINAVVTCVMKLFQNYFRCLLRLINIFQRVQCRRSNSEIISKLFQRLKWLYFSFGRAYVRNKTLK